MRAATNPAVPHAALRRQLLWAGVTAVSILSAYVHTVQASVLRGESLRLEQRGASVALAVQKPSEADSLFAFLAIP